MLVSVDHVHIGHRPSEALFLRCHIPPELVQRHIIVKIPWVHLHHFSQFSKLISMWISMFSWFPNMGDLSWVYLRVCALVGTSICVCFWLHLSPLVITSCQHYPFLAGVDALRYYVNVCSCDHSCTEICLGLSPLPVTVEIKAYRDSLLKME